MIVIKYRCYIPGQIKSHFTGEKYIEKQTFIKWYYLHNIVCKNSRDDNDSLIPLINEIRNQ